MRSATKWLFATKRSGAGRGPASQRRSQAPRAAIARRARGRGAAGAEVVVVAVPDVPHRRVAVADVRGAGPGRTPLATQWELETHEVEAVEVERLRRRGEERAGSCGSASDPGKALHEGRVDRARLELRRRPSPCTWSSV